VEQREKKTPTAELNPKDWLDQWTKEDESLAGAARPGPDDPDASLGEIWDDDNRRRSLQYQNLYLRIQHQKAKSDKNKHESQVLELRDRVRELEMLVIQSQERELEALNRVRDAHSSKTVSTQAPGGPSGGPPLRNTNTSPRINVAQPPQTVTDSESPPPAMSTKPPANPVRVSVPAQRASIAPPTVSNRYQRASSVLAPNSSVKRAVGSSPSLGRYSLVLRTSCEHVRTLPALSGAVPIVPSTFRTSLSLASHPEPIGPLFPRSGPSSNTQEHVRNLSHCIRSLSSQRSASHVIVPSLLVHISLSLVIT
jgi:hypothetical protein